MVGRSDAAIEELTPVMYSELSASTFVLAYYEDTAVKTIALGSLDYTSAKGIYDVVSLNSAKVLIHQPSNMVLFRHGQNEFVELCIQAMRQVDAFVPDNTKAPVAAPPVASSTFIIAYHEFTAVKIITLGSLDYAGAKKAYEAVSLNFAKVLIEKPSNKVVFQYGLDQYVQLCIQEGLQVDAFVPDNTNAVATPPVAPSTFIIAYHEYTAVKIINLGSLDYSGAKKAYEDVSLNFAKVLIEKPSNKVVFQYGLDQYVQLCIQEGRQAVATPPVAPSTFIIAYHEYTAVKIINLGSLDYTGAKQAYENVSLNFAKVLIEKPSNKVVFQYGLDQYVQLCIQEGRQAVATPPVAPSTFIIAYHEYTAVKIINLGSLDYSGAKKAYEDVSLNFAKVLIEKPSNKVVFQYGLDQYVQLCIQEGRQAVATPPVAPSTFIIAYHEYTAVKIINLGSLDYTGAKQAYENVSLNFAKVLIEKPSNKVVFQYGLDQYVQLCIQEGRQVVATPPVASSSFIIAYHEFTVVKTIKLGSLDYAGAKKAYENVSLNFAKVLIEKPSNKVHFQYGLRQYVQLCIQEVEQMKVVIPETTKEIATPLAPFILAFYERTAVKTIALGSLDYAGAKKAYEAVSVVDFAKVLIQKSSNTVLFQHGIDEYVQLCIQEVRQVEAYFPENTIATPWESSTFILVYHDAPVVRTVALGSLDDTDAQRAYEAVSLDFAKVLINQPSNTVVFQQGTNESVELCTHEVRQMKAFIPKNTKEIATPVASNTFILAFHDNTAVNTIALGSLDYTGAKKAYEAVSRSFAKVLVHKPSNTVLFQHGLNQHVELCIKEVRCK